MWKAVWIYSFLPRTHNKLIPRQVKGQLGVVSDTREGESGYPWAESWEKERKKEHKYVMHLETIHTFINGDYITVSAPFAVCYASTAMYLLYYFFT